MGWVLRRPTDRTNPTLPGGVYGFYITAGHGVYWHFEAGRVHFVLFISDGGRYGMDSSALKVSYKGVDIPSSDYKFHPGTYTKQITPYQISSVSSFANTFSLAAHPFNNDDQIRLRNRGGALPGGSNADKKYFVVEKTADTFKVSLTSGGAAIDLTDAGTGTHYAWKADAGWDDPDQGLPTFCPQTLTTLSGIAYVEGKLPAVYNTNEEPDWEEFRVEGLGRKLMDYDADGNETGVVSGDALLRNPALGAADCLVVEYKKPLSRIDFPSWFLLKEASPAEVWQRADTSQSGTGWRARYYNYSGGAPPNVNSDGTLMLEKREPTIDLQWAVGQSPTGVTGTYFAIYESRLKPKYSENYTFTLLHDDGVRLYVDDVLVINQWVAGAATHTAIVALTANQLAKVRLEHFDSGRPSQVQLKWHSASQALEVVPVQAAFEPDVTIPRYELNTAFAQPTEAAEVFERIIERCPGWDWTDHDGKIVFLAPDRPIQYEFVFDAEDDDAKATFLDGSFEKKLRHRRDRRNFALWSFRNRLYTGYPEHFVEEHRPRLREFGGGMPDNYPPEDLMVMFEGQARRIAEAEFKLTTDPTHTIALDAQKPSGVVTKNCYVRVKNLVKGDRRVEDSVCIVTSANRQGNKLNFSLLPIPYPFYEDEEVEGEGGEVKD